MDEIQKNQDVNVKYNNSALLRECKANLNV